ncbi:SRPBCC domain-containing protein [Streptomyces sp. NPDC058867]|uniref:SRPBCC domain-containing protein n=1 Tax=unclassified Streptomyces TaxID=2593676 RepID=UPI0036AA146B
MELEVFVPVAAARLREALRDPARVARALPGLQQDAGAETPVSGRLKVRVGGHTITYRGALSVVERPNGSYAVEGDATEARGTGAVKLALTLRVDEAEDGATLTAEGTATADGRIAQIPPDQTESAMKRLLTRFTENLATTEPAEEPEPAQEPEPPAADGDPAPQGPPAPDDEPPAPATQDAAPEAAHARRTMIGRSAEEVDHAPPRGRYAPVPAPQPAPSASALRWAAPAALAVASAIVVGRVLRKRR